MGKQLTVDEVRERFLEHVRGLVEWWDKESRAGRAEALSGLAFTILSTLDGGHGGMPKFMLIADPHPDDRGFHDMMGEDWFPEAALGNDLAGTLHERFHE